MVALFPYISLIMLVPGKKTSAFSVFMGFAALTLTLLGLRTLVGEMVWVPSGSMEPTVQERELVLVSKWRRNFHGSEVFKAGELVVFRSVKEPGLLLLKRIVAVGGDKVRIVPGEGLWVNERRLTSLTDDQVQESWLGATVDLNWRHISAWEMEVPPGHFLALGDNRDNSADSRTWGSVPLKNIVGQAKMVLWSCEAGGLGAGCDPSRVRAERLLLSLEGGG